MLGDAIASKNKNKLTYLLEQTFKNYPVCKCGRRRKQYNFCKKNRIWGKKQENDITSAKEEIISATFSPRNFIDSMSIAFLTKSR